MEIISNHHSNGALYQQKHGHQKLHNLGEHIDVVYGGILAHLFQVLSFLFDCFRLLLLGSLLILLLLVLRWIALHFFIILIYYKCAKF